MVIHTDTADTGSYAEFFSPDSKCPNEPSSIYANDSKYSCAPVNPKGNSLFLQDLKMPLMLMKSKDEVDRIKRCYETHNLPSAEASATYPLCAAELTAFMFGAGSSEVCLRRNNIIRNFSPVTYCQAVGGYSSLAFLAETPKGETRAKMIVLAARTDTFSLFENSEPGTSSPVSALSVLLAVAEALHQNPAVRKDIKDAGYNVLFVAFAGESFDYIGSQKLVYDMSQGFFPNSTSNSTRMYMSDIDLFVELSQFIDMQGGTIYTHTDPNTRSKHPAIDEFINALISEKVSVTVRNATSDKPLPPASAQMFLREDRATGIPVVVLADYDDEYTTHYYNSYLDTPEVHSIYLNRSAADYDQVSPHANYLSNVATSVSRAVYKYATKKPASSVSASNTTTNHLLYCFLITRQCDLFYATIGVDYTNILNQTDAPFNLYVSVYSVSTLFQHAHLMIRQLLAFYTGEVVPGSNYDNCTDSNFNPQHGMYINGSLVNGTRTPLCIKSTAQYHNASSPAFEIEDYDFASRRYSTWTESQWSNSAFRVRVFLRPSAEVELASMIAGICIFILSAVAAVLLQKRASILFPPQEENVQLVPEGNGPT